ncbi:MAG: zf-HC2 domain-containing protein [Blastocatellia bacterium]|nr:zf-HC2 domain-containing protein [Blastocatellia bacterium]
MNEKEKYLSQSDLHEHFKRGWRCPDDVKLAAYADQLLPGELKRSIERHLAECDSCLAQVTFLVRSSDTPDPEPVPAHILLKVQNLVPAGPGSNSHAWRWALATTAVACLLFAAVLGIALQERHTKKSADPTLVARNEAPPAASSVVLPHAPVETAPVPGPTDAPKQETRPIRTPPPSVRGMSNPGSVSPNLVFPTEGASVSSGDLVFRWLPIQDAQFYGISVMTAAGELVFFGQSEKTQVRLPAASRLKSGGKYFVQVTANLPQGNTIKSPVVSFRVSR